MAESLFSSLFAKQSGKSYIWMKNLKAEGGGGVGWQDSCTIHVPVTIAPLQCYTLTKFITPTVDLNIKAIYTWPQPYTKPYLHPTESCIKLPVLYTNQIHI